MPFAVRQSNLDPGNYSTSWAAGVGRSGGKLAAGYASPRVNPKQAAQAAQAAWLANTQAAAQKWHDNVGSYDEDAAINAMKNQGAQRYAASAQTALPKVQKKAPALIAAIKAGMAQLPADRSTFQARQTRSTSMQNYMHSQKGKI